MAKRSTTWIVVADSARSRFFAPSDDMKKLVAIRSADLVSPESRELASELKSDKPGRSYSSSRSGMRHALEPPHDYQKLEKHRFVAELAKELDVACGRKEFDNLILVAPRRSLGELRTLLPKRVKDCVLAEIARDLTKETSAGLFQRLKELLVPGSAKRLTRSLPARS